MPGALILDIPLGLGLALMAVIGSHFLEAERGLCNDMIDERNRVSMRLFVVADLERSYADRVINSAVLEMAEFFSALANGDILTSKPRIPLRPAAALGHPSCALGLRIFAWPIADGVEDDVGQLGVVGGGCPI